LQAVADEQPALRAQTQEIHKIRATLDPEQGSPAQRQQRFQRLRRRLAGSSDPVRQQMAVVMAGFLAGLFVGGDVADVPEDNLDLERWFRLPKGHERRIHGHAHAGVRLVQEGATLIPTLDAHRDGAGPFTAAELVDYRAAVRPVDEQAARARRKVMRRARSKKQRPLLLAELEHRYNNET
jgi:hypothetical protein